MTIREVLNQAFTILGKEMMLDAEILLAHALNKDRSWMLAHGDREVGEHEALLFQTMIERRKAGESVAYITGTKEFFGLDFKVNSDVLVPRPETELLVEMGLEELDKNPAAIVIDVGTGSGAIAVSVADQVKKKKEKVKIFATDISQDARSLAKENARRLHVADKIEFLHGNLLEPVLNFDFLPFTSLIILANLPYLSEAEYQAESSIQKEPKVALVAGEDGNALYRELFEQIKKLPEAVPWTLFAEFDPRHASWMLTTAKEYFPNKEIRIQKDLAGRERILCVR